MPEQLNKMEAMLAELSGKVDALYESSEKMRKYFLWTLVVTLAVIILPLFILPMLLPAFLSSVALPAGL